MKVALNGIDLTYMSWSVENSTKVREQIQPFGTIWHNNIGFNSFNITLASLNKVEKFRVVIKKNDKIIFDTKEEAEKIIKNAEMQIMLDPNYNAEVIVKTSVLRIIMVIDKGKFKLNNKDIFPAQELSIMFFDEYRKKNKENKFTIELEKIA